MIFIKTRGGLSNQLRTLLSWNIICKENNCKLYVEWNNYRECNGNFLDYFKPIKNITFIKNNKNNLKVCYEGGQIHPLFEKIRNKNTIYKELIPRDDLMEEVKKKIEILEDNYIAVHIRRTDFFDKYKKKCNDEYFMNFIDKFKNNKNLYVATDNQFTYNKFYKKYKNLMKFDYHDIIKRKQLRKTSLRSAIIDIYMCVYSKNFLGTIYSSFSDIIDSLRIIKKLK